MHVVSHCSLRAGTQVWQPRLATWALTVVCKVKFLLRPSECTLAAEQESPIEVDEYWNDDPNRSLRAVDELVPVKPRADVILVGYAFAPGGIPTRSIIARLIVGDIDKAIEVQNDRVIMSNGAMQEGGRFVRQQLTYERAAGGPGTWNPVGISAEARDAYGRRTLPNLVPPGIHVVEMNTTIAPVGFGPIAPNWPIRREKLGPHGARFSASALREWSIPEGFDLGYFNQAPLDQQVSELRANERIVLENLHAEHPRLVTSLPGVKPALFATRPRSPSPQRLSMRADTLWIDTESATVSLVFRGQVPLEHRDEAIHIAVLMEAPGYDVNMADAERALGVGMRAPAPTLALANAEDAEANGHGDPMQGTLQLTPQQADAPKTALPFVATQAPVHVPIPPAVSSSQAIPPAWVPVARNDGPMSPWAGTLATDHGSPRETTGMAAAAVALNAPSANVAEASRGGAAAASDAAAGAAPWNASKRELMPQSMQSLGVVATSNAITLLWYDPESVPRVRRNPPWRGVLDNLEQKPLDRELDDPALSKNPMDAEDRRDIFEIITHGTQTDERSIDESFVKAIRDDGKFVPPLVLLAGDIETPFDELAQLRATVSVAVPLRTSADEGLEAALSSAKEFLATPDLAAIPGVCEGLAMRIREGISRGKKTALHEQFDAQIERFLLAGRHYQKREVFGDTHLRVLIRLPGGSQGLVGYLPASLAKKLPMWKRFGVRLIVEVHPAQDQYEIQALGVRIVAIARSGTGAKG